MRVNKLTEDVDGRLDNYCGRLQALEEKIKSISTHDHLAEVYKKIHKLSEVLSRVTASLTDVEATLIVLKEQVYRMDLFWRNKSNAYASSRRLHTGA